MSDLGYIDYQVTTSFSPLFVSSIVTKVNMICDSSSDGMSVNYDLLSTLSDSLNSSQDEVS